jgi:tetratricopeptide (TPR) repeat protein
VAIVFLGIPGRSLSADLPTAVDGELHSEAPLPFLDYRVELTDPNRAAETHRAFVQLDGTFHLRDIPAGQYMLRVTTVNGGLVHQEFVSVSPQAAPLTVRLPGSAKQPSAPGTVSMTQLRHPPARKAWQAMCSAQHFAESGQTEKAVEELEKAIRISPEYAEAYNNLAVQHIRMDRFEEAAAELARALAISGPSSMQLSNLAYAQYRLNRFPEGIASARAALRLDSSSPRAHLILGSILAVDPRTRAESIPHLERAAETLPSARAALQQLRRAP